MSHGTVWGDDLVIYDGPAEDRLGDERPQERSLPTRHNELQSSLVSDRAFRAAQNIGVDGRLSAVSLARCIGPMAAEWLFLDRRLVREVIWVDGGYPPVK